MHILKTGFNGNPNIGLYGYCNDRFCLVGHGLPKQKLDEIEEALGVPVHEITICGTSLIGVFITGNTSTILVPSIAFDSELKKLDKLKIDYKIIDGRLTALGNNILCNDSGALVNPEFSADQKKEIRKALGVKVVPGTIADLPTVGSLGVMNTTTCAIHRDATEEEQKIVSKLLCIECVESTINMGSPYIKSGLLLNDNGFIIGDHSSGPEINNIDDELGYLERENEKKRG